MIKRFFGSKLVMVAGLMVLAAAGSYALAQDSSAGDDLNAKLAKEACRQITVYQPDQDGSAEYKPGVDVTGKPVVEADVGGTSLPAPEVVEFNLTVDMARYLGLTVSPRPEGQIGLGTISVLSDGRILRNGQPMEPEAETALRALCRAEKTP